MNANAYIQFVQSLSDAELKYAPKQLFWQGDFDFLLQGIKVSVVGSRKASAAGLLRAERITKALVEHNITVVSGLAEGIDTVAHKTAIRLGGKTIAVLGTPLDVVFPAKNKDLLEEITKHHLAISQFPSGHPYHESNFPTRNRTMALISDATIIVEATENSGTRHQGWEALRLGRLVFIMQNVFQDESLTWPKKMLDYGAMVLTNELVFPKQGHSILEDIPNVTTPTNYVF